MMHFLSDANETFEEISSKGYPFAFMLACGGYLLTMALVTTGRVKEMKVEVEEGRRDEGEGGRTGSDVHPMLAKTSSFGDTLLLILALCFHSVFQGIAVWNCRYERRRMEKPVDN
ncbi:hypothetical protein H6P81_002579 [Aristolochia fimbriata]|uniref:Uncharacterized protein n=1 Tax=Aristolochia fimbriata TaxID=158543 RepID=A0AAV7FE02_ARIFI|nr:hypothetical protein H6P81_002579 [Aristolochia fimbriata]